MGTGGRPSDLATACTECQRWPEALETARAATALEGPARAMVHRLKYHGWAGLANAMAPLIHKTMQGYHYDWLIPIPTTAWRTRIRGYNQAERIARAVSKIARIPVLDALVRPRARGTQVALQPHERLANVKRAFLLREASWSELQATRVCLVDDVLTTGATASAAAVILRDSGAQSVSAITFARSPALRGVSG